MRECAVVFKVCQPGSRISVIWKAGCECVFTLMVLVVRLHSFRLYLASRPWWHPDLTTTYSALDRSPTCVPARDYYN